jgi:AraC-like DNA-binding protein
MSEIQNTKPEFEIVNTKWSIRYLEHGWPTSLCRWHAHEEYELHLMLETTGKVFIGDYVGRFEPGSLFLTGPNMPHNMVTDEKKHREPVELRDMVIQFNRKTMDKAIEIFPELKELVYLLDSAKSGIEFVDYDMEKAKSYLAAIRDLRGVQRIVKFLEFLEDLNEWKQKSSLSFTEFNSQLSADSQSKINEVVNFVISNYQEKISLDEVASIANMSKSAFSRYFMKNTGNRFSDFVSRIRIGKACTLLLDTNDSVASIAFASGYNNLANFNRQFVSLKGMTPRNYRQASMSRLSRK